MEKDNLTPNGTCDEAMVEGFIAGAIRGRDQYKERLRHFLIDTGDVVFTLDDLLTLIEEAGAF